MLQGLNTTIAIYERQQQSDDDIGGSVQIRSVRRSGVPARIGATRSPMGLRVQGIEASNLYDCVCQSPDLTDLIIRIDDIVVPESGQYQGMDFVVLAIQDDSIADSPGDLRRHKYLSLRRWEEARRIQ